MENYDPNIFNGTHIIRVTLQEWQYKGHIAFQIGGNCKGTGILESGLSFSEFDGQEDIDRYTENDCGFAYHESDDDSEEGWYSCILKNDSGDELQIDDLDTDGVKNIIIAVEIINVEEDESEDLSNE